MSKHSPAEAKLHVAKEMRELHQPKQQASLRPKNSMAVPKGINSSNQYR